MSQTLAQLIKGVSLASAPAGALTVDSSGRVGIGTTSPDDKLDIEGTGDVKAVIQTTSTGTNANSGLRLKTGDYNWILQTGDAVSGGIRFYDSSNSSERARIDSSGNFKFNSGYGSVATAYGVRAWANINGTGTIAIRDSGNISSITDHGAGQYTFTFTNNLPDANYSFVLTGNEGTPNNGSIVSAPSQSANSTSSIRVDCVNNGGARIDMEFLSLVIVR